MADTLESPNPTETPALRAPADEAAVTDAVVVVYLTTTTDNAGRPLGIISGYQPAHILEPALTYRMSVLPTIAGIAAALEQVFFDLNVGDDPAFVATPKAAVLRYRACGHRSLSVGDVVEVLDKRYTVDRCGFRQI